MAERCLFYYITDRTAFGGNERERRRQLIGKIGEAAANGIDYIQLREKDLSTRDLELLAREAMSAIRGQSKPGSSLRAGTALLINSRTDIALAACTDGVHVRADDISPQDVRRAWSGTDRQSHGCRPEPLIGVSCHSQEDVARSKANGADFAVFAPVFEKKDAPESVAAGLDGLRRACAEKIPVFALGGITLANADSCLRLGAAGVAGIRLFQENVISEVMRVLRESRGQR